MYDDDPGIFCNRGRFVHANRRDFGTENDFQSVGAKSFRGTLFDEQNKTIYIINWIHLL